MKRSSIEPFYFGEKRKRARTDLAMNEIKRMREEQDRDARLQSAIYRLMMLMITDQVSAAPGAPLSLA